MGFHQTTKSSSLLAGERISPPSQPSHENKESEDPLPRPISAPRLLRVQAPAAAGRLWPPIHDLRRGHGGPGRDGPGVLPLGPLVPAEAGQSQGSFAALDDLDTIFARFQATLCSKHSNRKPIGITCAIYLHVCACALVCASVRFCASVHVCVCVSVCMRCTCKCFVGWCRGSNQQTWDR